jgi:hypothetical protein
MVTTTKAMRLRNVVLLLVLVSVVAVARAEDHTDAHWAEHEMDTAWLSFEAPNDTSAGDYAINFVSDNCYKCAPIRVFNGNVTRRLKISSQFPWSITLTNANAVPSELPTILDTANWSFKEYGHYRLTFKPSIPGAKLYLEITSPGTLSIIPIIVAVSVCICTLCGDLKIRQSSAQPSPNSDNQSASTVLPNSSTRRSQQ